MQGLLPRYMRVIIEAFTVHNGVFRLQYCCRKAPPHLAQNHKIGALFSQSRRIEQQLKVLVFFEEGPALVLSHFVRNFDVANAQRVHVYYGLSDKCEAYFSDTCRDKKAWRSLVLKERQQIDNPLSHLETNIKTKRIHCQLERNMQESFSSAPP